MRKLVVALGWATAAFAAIAACSGRHDPRWSMTPLTLAQPMVEPDPNQFPLPGCPCEPSIEVDLTVTDSAGNPIKGVTFPGSFVGAVCIGSGDGDAASDAESTEGGSRLDSGSADGGAEDSAPDASATDGALAFDAPDAIDPLDGPAIDSSAGDAGAADALARDAAEAGASACRTWRVTVSQSTGLQPAGFEVFAPGYVRRPVTLAPSSTPCCEPVPAVSGSIVLQPLPACPAAYKPCTIDAGFNRDSLTCACP